MTFMSFVIIPGEKKSSAHGTSGVLFLIKMGCLLCFLLTTENHLSNWEKNHFFSVSSSLVSLVCKVVKQ